MPLIEHLAKRDDPIRALLDAWLPNYGELRRQWRALGPIQVVPDGDVRLFLVSVALSYRIRFFYEELDATKTKAAHVLRYNDKFRDTFATLARDLHKFCDDNSPKSRLLPPKLEESLLRYCYVLALYETKSWSSLPYTPLSTLKKESGSRAQLNRVPQCDLDDLKKLAEAAYATFEPLLDSAYYLTPKFSDSRLVDGANADLIVGRNLIQIWVNREGFQSNRIRQSVAYSLLDASCKYELEECSIYLARWGKLLTWNLDELILNMSNGLQDYESLRRNFHEGLLIIRNHKEESQLVHQRIQEIMKSDYEEFAAISDKLRYARYIDDRQLVIANYQLLKNKMGEMKIRQEELTARFRDSPISEE